MELITYLEQPVLRPLGKLGMSIPSLNRADVFLFILCDLFLSDQQTSQAITYWYALHTSYLLMDDIHDYKNDIQNKEENSIFELGVGNLGFEKAFEVLLGNAKTLKKINPLLGSYFEESIAGLYNLIP